MIADFRGNTYDLRGIYNPRNDLSRILEGLLAFGFDDRTAIAPRAWDARES
jgi:hypothetical protein